MSIKRSLALQALRWIDTLETPEDIQTHWLQFETWLEASAHHGDAYHRAELARSEAAFFGNLLQAQGIDEEVLVAAIWLQFPRALRHTALRAALPLAATTASIFAIACVITAAYILQSPWSRYDSTPGQSRTLELPDGSGLVLDTDSVVWGRFTLAHRDLVLERGRALFQPRHEQLRTFDVSVNRHVVRATGTRFVVDRKSGDEFETLVTQGKVQVRDTEHEQQHEDPRTVQAEELLAIGPVTSHLEKIAPSDVEHRLAWTRGELEFEHETLEQAVEEFNRYNRCKLVIADPKIRTLKVGGRYNAHKPEWFAEALSHTHPIAIEHFFGGAPGSQNNEEIRLRSAQ